MKTPLPFNREADFEPGILQEVSPGLRRILAPNPGPFTFKGTNCYVIGSGDVAVVDPGPDDAQHIGAVLNALAVKGERVAQILLTHAHPDHSGGIPALRAATGAPTFGFGRRDTGAPAPRAPSGKALIDVNFKPDKLLSHGERFRAGGWELEALHTPGHAPDHLCFAIPAANVLLSGDHVMGWNTTVVAPPEGHMGDYLKSLDMLLKRSETAYFPGHGGRVDQPQRLVKAFMVHRRWREAEIVEALREGINSPARLVPRIYAQLDSALHGAAALSIFAQLELLHETGAVVTRGPLSPESEFFLTDR